MRSVIKTFAAMNAADKGAFKALQEEELKRTGKKPSTSELLNAVTPDGAWVDTDTAEAA